MNVDMIEDIVKAIKTEYDIKDVDVDYDFMPVNTGSVLDAISILLEDESHHWIATGEMWIIPSKAGDDTRIQIILLKRGVEIDFIIPHGLSEKASDEKC